MVQIILTMVQNQKAQSFNQELFWGFARVKDMGTSPISLLLNMQRRHPTSACHRTHT
jgi:hypothetical protein